MRKYTCGNLACSPKRTVISTDIITLIIYLMIFVMQDLYKRLHIPQMVQL